MGSLFGVLLIKYVMSNVNDECPDRVCIVYQRHRFYHECAKDRAVSILCIDLQNKRKLLA